MNLTKKIKKQKNFAPLLQDILMKMSALMTEKCKSLML